jgi:hypothetical protein
MKKSTVFFISATMLLVGVIIGFLTSPVKRGISVGNRSFPVSHPFPPRGCCASKDEEEEEEAN